MAKASKKTKAPRVWQDDDVVVLLAWLDYCLVHSINFKETVTDHVYSNLGKSVTISQVEGRLRSEWNRLGAVDSKSSTDLFREGTRCLELLTDDDRQRIQLAVAVIGPPPTVPRASSVSSTLSTISSIATDGVGGVQEERTLNDRLIDGNNQARNNQDTVWDASESTWSSGPRPEANTDKQSDYKHSELITAPVTEQSAVGHVIARGARTAAQETVQDEQLRLYVTRLSDAKDRERELEREVFCLHDELFAARREREDLEHNHRAAKTGDTYAQLRSLYEENERLKRHIESQATLREDSRAIDSGRLGLVGFELGYELHLMTSNIANACASINMRASLVAEHELPSSLDNMSHPLCAWISRATGLKDMSSFLSWCSGRGVYESKQLDCVVAAITCGLIFEPSISDLFAMDCPLLKYYKERTSQCYGPAALRHIDLLAWKSLLTGDYFQTEECPRRARMLANRAHLMVQDLLGPTTEDLSPFDPDCQSSHTQDELDAMDQEELGGPLDSAQVPVFWEAFTRALQLKSRLSLSDQRYRWVFFKPDSTFDIRLMRLTVSGKSPGTDVPRGSHKIRLCLFPALYKGRPAGGFQGGDVSWDEPRFPEVSADVQDWELVSSALVLI